MIYSSFRKHILHRIPYFCCGWNVELLYNRIQGDEMLTPISEYYVNLKYLWQFVDYLCACHRAHYYYTTIMIIITENALNYGSSPILLWVSHHRQKKPKHGVSAVKIQTFIAGVVYYTNNKIEHKALFQPPKIIIFWWQQHSISGFQP